MCFPSVSFFLQYHFFWGAHPHYLKKICSPWIWTNLKNDPENVKNPRNFADPQNSDMSVLPPTGSDERGVLGVGSIPVAIFPSCQDMKTIALKLPKQEYSWVLKVRNTSEAVL